VIDQLRVAAGQYAATQNLDENLESCLRLIEEAGEAGADLLVLPEFANHISVYESAEHCREVAVELAGTWMSYVRERAKQHGIYVSLAVTVPRENDRITITNVLIDDQGEIVATADKQTLMGNERAYLSGGACSTPVAETRFGPVGIYACMDGVTFETPRTFAVRGARLMLNSLNSFALDEAALHIPVRAVENGVFVVAANKVGPLLPADQVSSFSEALGIPPDALNGAGESQIITPDGEVLAVASRTDEELIVADIDLSTVAAPEERFGARRPELYEALGNPDSTEPRDDVPDAVAVRCVPGAADVEVVARAFDGDARLVVLPEGTPVPMVVPDDTWLVTSSFVDGAHFGQVWSADGLVHEQLQLHRTDRLPNVTELGDRLDVLSTPWGDVAVIVGDDHLYPETVRLASIQGAHVAVVLYAPTEDWQIDLAIRERAAENRLCLVACAPQGTAGTMVLNPPHDSLWSTDRNQPYDGTINTPDAVLAPADNKFFDAMIHPARALRREISRDTDLVGGRPWQASAELL